jgi:type IV pilus assembly protein PilB
MSENTFKLLDNIGGELVDAGLISADQLAVVQETQRNLGGDLGHILIRKGFLTKDQILEFLSERMNIPFVSLKDYIVDPDMMKIVPVSLAKKYRLMPLFKIENTITLAMADPLDIFAIDELRNVLKSQIQPVFASGEEIERFISENYRLVELACAPDEDIEVVQYRTESADEVSDRLQEMASGSKVIAEVNRIIRSAITDRASDIHIEPMENSVKVRNRIDGVLEERIILAKSMHLPIITRIKIMGEMDIAERRVPQDGRVRIKIHGQMMDMRLSTYPTMHGEKVVIRLLTKEQVVGVDSLGFNKRERDIFEEIILKPHGIFLVTGPTGSGKTTTLYAALQKLNSQDRNIVSIEDPIENAIAGVSQAQVNMKAGMTFASAMRSILRQDPDIIMVGEIRDDETADMAVRAAITGHLVLSTIHTNTALGAITRLEDLGVKSFMVASSIAGVMAQRLVRCVCKHCKKEVHEDETKLIALGLPPDTKTFRGAGCKYCRMSGYLGRMGLFEISDISGKMREMIIAGATEAELSEESKKRGLKTLFEQGIDRVIDGSTSVSEVLRVTEADI